MVLVAAMRSLFSRAIWKKQSQSQGLGLAVYVELVVGGLQPGPQDLVGPSSDLIRKHPPVGLGVRDEG